MPPSSRDRLNTIKNSKKRRRELAGLRNTAANAGPPSSSKTFGTKPPPARGPGKALQRGYKVKQTGATRFAGAALPFVLPDPRTVKRAFFDPVGTAQGAAEIGTFLLPETQARRLRNQLTPGGKNYFSSLTGADTSDIEQAVEIGGLIPTGKIAASSAKLALKGATAAGRKLGRSGLESSAAGIVRQTMKSQPRSRAGRTRGEALSNDLEARKVAYDALVANPGRLFTPRSVGLETTIPFRAVMGYGLERPVDPVWASGAMKAESVIRSTRRPGLVGLVTGQEAADRISKTGRETFTRSSGEARKSGALISVKDKTTGGTIGSKVQKDVSKITGPNPLGQQRMAQLFQEGRIKDDAFTSELYPGTNPGEMTRANSMLAAARGTEGIFTVLRYDKKTGGWRHMGTDETDHNPVGQRLLYRAGASLLEKAGTRSTKARKNYEQQVSNAYMILSGRLDVTPRTLNQLFGSNLRTGSMTDPAYTAAGQAGLRRQLEFLVDEGHMLRIHEDNWNLLKDVAPDVAREIEMLTRIRGFVDEMGNPFVNQEMLY